jgi:glutamine synthetase
MTEMKREEVVMLCTSDLAGQTRGKGFPLSDLDARLKKGIGWTPTNSMITAFGAIAPSPWGPFGDLVLLPDPATHVHVDFGPDHAAENFLLGDICHLDGTPWGVCPRSFLKRVLVALEESHGLKVRAAFEHEFTYDGVEERPNGSYALDAFRRQDLFAETYLGALKQAGLELDTFMPEYGPMQYEVTDRPGGRRHRRRPCGRRARDRAGGRRNGSAIAQASRRF